MGSFQSKFGEFLKKIGITANSKETEARIKEIEAKMEAELKAITYKTDESHSNRLKNKLYVKELTNAHKKCKQMKLSVVDSCIATNITALTYKEELSANEELILQDIIKGIYLDENKAAESCKHVMKTPAEKEIQMEEKESIFKATLAKERENSEQLYVEVDKAVRNYCAEKGLSVEDTNTAATLAPLTFKDKLSDDETKLWREMLQSKLKP